VGLLIWAFEFSVETYTRFDGIDLLFGIAFDLVLSIVGFATLIANLSTLGSGHANDSSGLTHSSFVWLKALAPSIPGYLLVSTFKTVDISYDTAGLPCLILSLPFDPSNYSVLRISVTVAFLSIHTFLAISTNLVILADLAATLVHTFFLYSGFGPFGSQLRTLSRSALSFLISSTALTICSPYG